MNFIHYKRRFWQKIQAPFAPLRLKFLKDQNHYKIGSPNWLAATEKKYGGIQQNIPIRKISNKDKRTKKDIETQKMTGGDKMFHMGYSSYYSKFLKPFIEKDSSKLNIAEFGILNGSGLALLSDLFPNSNLFGFDIDLNNFIGNKSRLKKMGAFKNNEPKLFECDQFTISSNELDKYLKGKKLDIVIDDGLHSLLTIEKTARAIKPFMNKNSVFFVEDNSFAHSTLLKVFKNSQAIDCGALQVVTFR